MMFNRLCKDFIKIPTTVILLLHVMDLDAFLGIRTELSGYRCMSGRSRSPLLPGLQTHLLFVAKRKQQETEGYRHNIQDTIDIDRDSRVKRPIEVDIQRRWV